MGITIKKIIILITISLGPIIQQAQAIQESSYETIVKVLLGECEKTDSDTWKLGSKNGFILDDTVQKYTINSHEILIQIKEDGTIHINGKPLLNPEVNVTSADHTIIFNDKSYSGSFLITSNNTSHKLINCINIEDYVASVVQSESWPNWPLEANKVQAIASRTYVMNKIQQAQYNECMYHVTPTISDQVYKGGNQTDIIKQAVMQTKGIILTHNNKPIRALFHSSCGGIIPERIDQLIGINVKKFPYLSRKHRCTFCKKAKKQTWKIHFDFDKVEKKIKIKLNDLQDLKNLKIVKKDKAGLVKLVRITGSKGSKKTHFLTGQQFFSLLQPKIKSFSYSLKKQGRIITLTGLGYGHHLGLCQWGSYEMVNQGWNHKDILEFYYPGTQLTQI